MIFYQEQLLHWKIYSNPSSGKQFRVQMYCVCNCVCFFDFEIFMIIISEIATD